MGINMHIHKPGHASLMTRGGWIQSFAGALSSRAPLLALRKTLLQPLHPVCNQNALKAQFHVLSSVCIALVKAPLYSDSSRALCWTVHRVFQTDSFVCMQNTHSHHLGSSWASEQNRKLAELHLDEQTGIYRNRQKKDTYIHRSYTCPCTWSTGLTMGGYSMQGNGCQWPVSSKLFGKGIYIKKTEAGAF